MRNWILYVVWCCRARDYDMWGRLDEQAWSFDVRMIKCEGDIRRVEQVSADRAREQQLKGLVPKDKITSLATGEHDSRQPLQVGEAATGGCWSTMI